MPSSKASVEEQLGRPHISGVPRGTKSPMKQRSDFASTSSEVRYPKIVLWGDSIAAVAFRKGGYGSELVSQYIGLMDVLSRGMPGYNSTQLLTLLEQHDVYSSMGSDVKLWVIHAGTNDACVEGLQKVDLSTFLRNMRRILLLIRTMHPESGIIVVTPAQCDNVTWMAWLKELGYPDDQGVLHIHDNSLTKRFAYALEQLCRELVVHCVNAFDAFERAMHNGKTLADLLYDGVHPTPAGNQVICDRLIPLIRARYPHLHPSVCSTPFELFAKYGYDHDETAKRYFQTLLAMPDVAKSPQQLLEMERDALRRRGYGKLILP